MTDRRYQVIVVAPAIEQVETIDAWWRQQRPKAPELFALEVERALTQNWPYIQNSVVHSQLASTSPCTALR